MRSSQFFQQRLEQLDISETEFQELVIRLVNYSVIVRDESQTEQVLYDRLIRVRELVEDYLSVIGVQLLVDTRFEYVRAFPPSSEIPGVCEAEESAWAGSLRKRLSQSQVALVLVIRAQYEKALKEGKIDEKGFALDSIESLMIAAKNFLGRSLSDKESERKDLFKRLRQLRLVSYRADETFESGEGWIKIHPMIVTFVSNAAVEGIVSEDEDSVLPVGSPGTVDEELDAIEQAFAIAAAEGEDDVS
ncbi:MAG: DUF4194 domain-containing protein [Gammaproteobacteria bacterium]|nr:DUF4194 domain-containing protein [Gammaproteobacteria bacterium]